MRPRPALFPSFFMGGFECSTHVDRSRRRQDFITLTQHDRFYKEDYERVRAAGIRMIREGLRWYLCDRGGRLDFSSITPMAEAAEAAGLKQINCFLHYGYPDDLDPREPSFVHRFAEYAMAYADWRRRHVEGPRWYAAVNELSLFTYAAGEQAWFAPFLVNGGAELKRALIRAALEATKAVRAVDSEAHFVSIDPVTHFVPPHGRFDLQKQVDETNEAKYEAWDMALGRKAPELGGHPDSFQVIGVNCYPDTQAEMDGAVKQLALDDPRRVPLSEVLKEVYDRYGKPIILAETSARADERPVWIRYVGDQVLEALRIGVDVQGICIFPFVDMREWKGGKVGDWGKLGLYDVREQSGIVERIPNVAYLAALREVQTRLTASGLLPTWQDPSPLPVGEAGEGARAGGGEGRRGPDPGQRAGEGTTPPPDGAAVPARGAQPVILSAAKDPSPAPLRHEQPDPPRVPSA